MAFFGYIFKSYWHIEILNSIIIVFNVINAYFEKPQAVFLISFISRKETGEPVFLSLHSAFLWKAAEIPNLLLLA